MNTVGHVFRSGHGDLKTAENWLGTLRPEISRARPSLSGNRRGPGARAQVGFLTSAGILPRGSKLPIDSAQNHAEEKAIAFNKGGDILKLSSEIEHRTKERENRNREVKLLISRYVVVFAAL